MFKPAVVSTLVLLAFVAAAQAEERPERDPMRPFGSAAGRGVTAAASAPRFALTGVLISPTRRVAMLNGRPVTQGQLVDGAELVAIEPGAVRLREHGTDFVIAMGRPGSGRPPTAQGETVP